MLKTKIVLVGLLVILSAVPSAEAKHPYRRFAKAVITFPIYTCVGIGLGVIAGAGVACLGPAVWLHEVKTDKVLDDLANARAKQKGLLVKP